MRDKPLPLSSCLPTRFDCETSANSINAPLSISISQTANCSHDTRGAYGYLSSPQELDAPGSCTFSLTCLRTGRIHLSFANQQSELLAVAHLPILIQLGTGIGSLQLIFAWQLTKKSKKKEKKKSKMPFIEQEDDEMLVLVGSDIHG